jgi:hypothetical protein
MGLGLSALLGRRRALEALRTYASGQAVCAVVVGARVRRLKVSRFGRNNGCEVEGFDDLPLFSKLVICQVGPATRTKGAPAVDDSVDTARAAALATEIAPSRHEAEQLLRLAREEAARIIAQRQATVRALSAALAKIRSLDGDQVAGMVLTPTRRVKRRRRLAADPYAKLDRAIAAWASTMLARGRAWLDAQRGRSGPHTDAMPPAQGADAGGRAAPTGPTSEPPARLPAQTTH